jgi:hypothetical protein
MPSSEIYEKLSAFAGTFVETHFTHVAACLEAQESDVGFRWEVRTEGD